MCKPTSWTSRAEHNRCTHCLPKMAGTWDVRWGHYPSPSADCNPAAAPLTSGPRDVKPGHTGPPCRYSILLLMWTRFTVCALLQDRSQEGRLTTTKGRSTRRGRGPEPRWLQVCTWCRHCISMVKKDTVISPHEKYCMSVYSSLHFAVCPLMWMSHCLHCLMLISSSKSLEGCIFNPLLRIYLGGPRR